MHTLVYHAGSVLDNVNTSLLCGLIGIIDPCIIRPVSGPGCAGLSMCLDILFHVLGYIEGARIADLSMPEVRGSSAPADGG